MEENQKITIHKIQGGNETYELNDIRLIQLSFDNRTVDLSIEKLIEMVKQENEKKDDPRREKQISPKECGNISTNYLITKRTRTKIISLMYYLEKHPNEKLKLKYPQKLRNKHEHSYQIVVLSKINQNKEETLIVDDND